jgi:hypothetical protein
LDLKGRQTDHGENCMMNFSNIVREIKIKEDQVGGTRDTHGGGEMCLQGFGWEA